MALVAGLDGGGTHTGVGLATGTIDSLRTHRSEQPGRVAPGDEPGACTRLATALQEARHALDVSEPVTAAVLGLAGAGDPDVARAVTSELTRRWTDTRVQVMTDVEIAFADAFGDGPGILLSAGTGSIALGSDGHTVHRTGGHGWRFGDDGGGYWIARQAINAVLQAGDGRGPDTQLSEYLGAVDYRNVHEPRDVALLTEHVCRAAEAGDDVADLILESAVDHLGEHVRALVRRFGSALPVALAGGVFDPRLPIRTKVREELLADGTVEQFVDRPVDPVRGAVRLALDLAR